MLQAIVKFPSDESYSENNIKGYILFTQYPNMPVVVEVNLSGLPHGKHGFHIHEYAIKQEYIQKLKKGQKVNNLCATLGGHFNPFNTQHGSYSLKTERHAGDLINNLIVNSDKQVFEVFVDPLISLNKNQINGIIGKSIVIHKDPDDEGIPGLLAKINNCKLTNLEEESLKTGNAGKRIACGNIKIF